MSPKCCRATSSTLASKTLSRPTGRIRELREMRSSLAVDAIHTVVWKQQESTVRINHNSDALGETRSNESKDPWSYPYSPLPRTRTPNFGEHLSTFKILRRGWAQPESGCHKIGSCRMWNQPSNGYCGLPSVILWVVSAAVKAILLKKFGTANQISNGQFEALFGIVDFLKTLLVLVWVPGCPQATTLDAYDLASENPSPPLPSVQQCRRNSDYFPFPHPSSSFLSHMVISLWGSHDRKNQISGDWKRLLGGGGNLQET